MLSPIWDVASKIFFPRISSFIIPLSLVLTPESLYLVTALYLFLCLFFLNPLIL